MEKKQTADELLAVIRAHCLDCCGGSRKDVHECNVDRCDLWPYRERPRKKRTKADGGQMNIYDYLK